MQRMKSSSRWLVLVILAALGEPEVRAQNPRDPVIMQDRTEIDRALREAGVPFDAIAVPSLDDARRARGDLARFLRAEIKQADRKRAAELRKLLRASPGHRWICGGFERGESPYLHCTFGAAKEAPIGFLPVTGDAAACRCIFSPKSGQIVAVRCPFDP